MHIRVGLHFGFIACVASVLVAWTNVGVPRPVHLDAGGAPSVHVTRSLHVGQFLKQAGVELQPGDEVHPPIHGAPAQAVRVIRALPVTLIYNGGARAIRTTAPTVEALLKEAGITVGPHDAVILDGRPAAPGLALPALEETATGRGAVMEVRTARSIYVHDAGSTLEVATGAPTVYQALHRAGILIHPGDLVTPDPGLPVRQGAHVYVERAKEVSIAADGERQTLRTRAATVQDVLNQAGLSLAPLDRASPTLDATIAEGLDIQITRVRDERLVESEVIPFETRRVADSDLEWGQQRIVEPGEEGRFVREHMVRYEDGQEVDRVLLREELERPPSPRVVHYGTKIIPRYVETGIGDLQYYRVLRVWATWYNPRSAGKPAWHPGYGITSVGVRVRRGIVAVDPRVIPYYTEMYIPGYGRGIAADTGGGIIGNKIDLGFADDEYPDWRTGWVDIYLLGSPPPGYQP